MKNKLNISTVVLALFSLIAVQTTVAQVPNTSPAKEALKGMRPFIGNWTGESDAFGGFEGLEEGGKILWAARFRWLQNKTAVEFTSQTKYKNTDKRFNSASQIMSLDAATGKLRTIGYGHDGSVYWSNTGSMEIKGKSITLIINEITINKTKSKYTVKFTKESPKILSLQLTDAYVDGKKQKDWEVKLHRITKSPRPAQLAVSAEEAEKIAEVITKLDQQWSQTALTKDTAFLKSIWADDLRFTQHDGKVNDKETALADAEGNTDTVTSGVISDYKVRVYGKNFAVVAGDYHSTGKDKDGKPFNRKIRFTGVWVRKQMSTGERKWQCVSDHSTKLE
jgi:ketosteroid isomerase-like protein